MTSNLSYIGPKGVGLQLKMNLLNLGKQQKQSRPVPADHPSFFQTQYSHQRDNFPFENTVIKQQIHHEMRVKGNSLMTRKLNLMNEELLIKQMVDAMVQESPRHLDPLFTPPQDKT